MSEQEAIALLLSAYEYQPDTGHFIVRAKRNPGGRQKVGMLAGSLDTNGRRQLLMKGQYVMAHRAAWLVYFGHWPKGQIDHLNGNRDDNRIANLRDVSAAVNSQNKRKAYRNSTSGLLGACKSGNQWVAEIRANGIRHYLGRFTTAEAAHEAYIAAKRRLHEGCTI